MQLWSKLSTRSLDVWVLFFTVPYLSLQEPEIHEHCTAEITWSCTGTLIARAKKTWAIVSSTRNEGRWQTCPPQCQTAALNLLPSSSFKDIAYMGSGIFKGRLKGQDLWGPEKEANKRRLNASMPQNSQCSRLALGSSLSSCLNMRLFEGMKRWKTQFWGKEMHFHAGI